MGEVMTKLIIENDADRCNAENGLILGRDMTGDALVVPAGATPLISM